MNIFEEIKEKSNILDIAKALGINLSRSDKALCPFHNEKTPSFSISPKNQIFKCFSCGEGGDSIALVSKMKNITPYESAVFINDILNLGLQVTTNNSPTKAPSNHNNYTNYNNSKIIIEAFNRWENETFLLLSDYRRHLDKKDDEESAQMLKAIDYYLDIFTKNDIEEKLEFFNNNLRVVVYINERFSRKDN